MKFLYLIFCVTITSVSAFFLSSSRGIVETRLTMTKKGRAEAGALDNLPRKVKRQLKNADAVKFQSILTPEFESFLVNEAKGEVYNTLMKKVADKAKDLKISLKDGFGVKPVVKQNDIVETATAAGAFNTLLSAATAAGLVETLKGDAGLTVFAPTDEAFKALPEGTLDGLLADPAQLAEVLKYHVIPGYIKVKKVVALDGKKTATVGGKELSFKVNKQDGEITIDGAAKIDAKSSVRCKNGWIHVINKVLIPK